MSQALGKGHSPWRTLIEQLNWDRHRRPLAASPSRGSLARQAEDDSESTINAVEFVAPQ
jgi:hypothetical protein